MFTYQMVIRWGPFFLGSLLLAACTTPPSVEPQAPVQEQVFSLDQLQLSEGMLTFEDEGTFWKAVSFLTEPDVDAYLMWAEEVQFTSLWHVYEAFSAYSEASYETGYDKSMADLRLEYGQAVQLEDDGMFWLNCPLPGAARLLNEEGVVKVGDALYLFEADRMIIIEDGDVSKLQTARRLPESNEDAGILVEPVHPY